MIRNEETRPAAGTAERAGTGIITRQASTPNFNFTTAAAGRQFQVASLLEQGKDHGIKRTDLAELVGVDERVLRRKIQQERKTGALILADCSHGYFLPGSMDELRRFTRQMQHRAGEVLAAARAAEAALAHVEGQEVMEGWHDG